LKGFFKKSKNYIDKIWKLRYNQSEFGGSQFIVKGRSGCKKQEDVLNYSSLLQNS